MVSITASTDFHTTFHALKNEITTLLDGSSPALADVASRLSTLKALYTTHSPTLPAYDQRQYGLILAELEKRVSGLRAKEKPRTRFAFTKKATTTSTSKPTYTAPTISKDSVNAVPSTPPILDYGTSGIIHDTLQEGRNLDNGNESIPATAISNTHTLSNVDGAFLSDRDILAEGEYTLSISNVSNSIIDLRPGSSSSSGASGKGRLMSLHGKGITRCVVLAGQMEGSALLYDVKDSLILLGAHQFRMHTSQRTRGMIHVSSVPVVEHSSDLTFGSYPASLGVEMVGENKVRQMADFDWIREGPSPNWRLLSTEEEVEVEKRLEILLGTLGPDMDVTEARSIILS